MTRQRNDATEIRYLRQTLRHAQSVIQTLHPYGPARGWYRDPTEERRADYADTVLRIVHETLTSRSRSRRSRSGGAK